MFGYSKDVFLSDFYSSISDKTSEAVAILGGISSDSTHLTDTSLPNYEIDSSYMAEESPIIHETSLENMGLAVFKDDKLVGELNGIETICHLIITNNLDKATITIPSPFDSTKTISLSISANKKTENSVTFLNGLPYISSKIEIKANVLSLDKGIDYTDNSNLELIETTLNSYLTSKVYEYLYKTSKEYNSDISGFRKAHKKKLFNH